MIRIRPLIIGTLLAVVFTVGSFFWAGANPGGPPIDPQDASGKPRHDLLISFSGNIEKKGQLVIQLYDDPESFAIRQIPFEESFLKVDLSDEYLWEFKDIPEGSYAVAVFHDKNENWRFDRDQEKKPAEMLGYSLIDSAKKNFPTFEDCLFSLNENRVINVKMN